MVAAGSVDAEALLACASKVIDARGGHAVTTTVGSFRAVRDASLSTTGGEIAVRRGGPLLLGAGAYLRSMIDAADGRAPTIRSSVAHGFLGRAVGSASVQVTVVLTPDQRRALAEELENGGSAGSPATSIRAGALGVRLGPTVGLHAILSCESASACGALATKLSAARDAHAQDFALRVVGFGAVLEQVKIVPEGELVHARVELPADQAALLAERLVTLRGLRHPMPGPSATGPGKASATGGPRRPPARPDEVITPDAGARQGPDRLPTEPRRSALAARRALSSTAAEMAYARPAMAIDTIPHRLFEQARTRPDAPAYHHKVDGRYRATSWAEYAATVRKAARALLALGFERGATVAIFGFNRPEWVILDLAAMAVGGAAAGIYTTCSADEVRYIVHHAESLLVLVENAPQWEKVRARARAPAAPAPRGDAWRARRPSSTRW